MKLNNAFDGGAMYLDGLSSLYFEDSNLLYENKALRIGGAIACIKCYLYQKLYGYLNISKNYANRGSALYFKFLMKQSNIFENGRLFIENNIAYHGGTIYWIYDREDGMSSSPDLNQTIIINNKAPYGERIGTQAIYLIGPSFYKISTNQNMKYNNNTLVFIAYDYYHHQLINVDSNKYLFIALIDEQYKKAHCLGYTPSVIR